MRRIRFNFRRYWKRLNGDLPKPHSFQDENYPPEKKTPKQYLFHLGLFLVTLFTTSFAGSGGGGTILEIFFNGLPYSFSLLSILLVHEFGHYFAARRFGVDATLPYFIPFPSLIGTMGAVIKTRTPVPHSRALLYIGAMGPLPGFIVSFFLAAYGISVSSIHPLPVVPPDTVPVFGDSILFAGLVHFFHGTIPAGSDIYLSPFAWAGWIGFLITGLNLMPIGQLDGGHVLFALIGRKQRYAGWMSFLALVILSFFWPGWILWLIIALLVLMIGHPPVGEESELTYKEKIMGWSCLAVLLMTFIPVPVRFL